MLNLSCLCGQVRINLDSRPDYINACNCTLCSKSGAQWAYVAPSGAVIEGATKGFVRADKDNPGAEIQFCTDCGSTTHFVLTPATIAKFGNTMVGVNMRLADEADLAGMELRYPDGRNWQGEGEFGYVREPVIIGVT